MRIIAGKYRGLKLASVGKGDPGAHLRPTTDRVRESLFNVLMGGAYGDPISGARVLDLFAGTGALGLEALSRGAAHVTFVDDGPTAGKLIRQNIEKCCADDQAELIRRNATRLGAWQAEPFSLAFIDPPYGKGLGQQALAAVRAGGWLAPQALVVWEENTPMGPPEGFDLLDTRRYGDTYVTVMEFGG